VWSKIEEVALPPFSPPSQPSTFTSPTLLRLLLPDTAVWRFSRGRSRTPPALIHATYVFRVGDTRVQFGVRLPFKEFNYDTCFFPFSVSHRLPLHSRFAKFVSCLSCRARIALPEASFVQRDRSPPSFHFLLLWKLFFSSFHSPTYSPLTSLNRLCPNWTLSPQKC